MVLLNLEIGSTAFFPLPCCLASDASLKSITNTRGFSFCAFETCAPSNVQRTAHPSAMRIYKTFDIISIYIQTSQKKEKERGEPKINKSKQTTKTTYNADSGISDTEMFAS